MRIYNNYIPYINNERITRNNTNDNKNAQARTDEFQKFLKTAVEAAEEINEVDTKKINEIKSRLEKDNYDVNNEQIARKLFLDMHI